MSGYGLTTPTKNHPNERFNSTFHLNWQKSDKTSVAMKSMPRRKKKHIVAVIEIGNQKSEKYYRIYSPADAGIF